MLFALLSLFVFAPAPSRAFVACSLSAPCKDTVKERRRDVLVFTDAKGSHLITRMGLSAERSLPSTIAWIVPVPAAPSIVEQDKPKALDELRELTRDVADDINLHGPINSVVDLHDDPIEGSYDTAIVNVTQDGSSAELQAWLKTGGFEAIPDEKLRPYLKKGAAFLASAVKLDPTVNAARVKPLHVIYPTVKKGVVTAPLLALLSSPDSTAELYVATKRAANSGSSICAGLKPAGQWKEENPESPASPELAAWIGSGTAHVLKFVLKGVPKADPSCRVASLSAR